MLKNKLNLLFIFNILLVFLSSIYIAFVILEPNKKIVYVDKEKLFEGFNMTKEMKQVGEKEFNSRKLSLDSLYLKLQFPAISKEEKTVLMQQFIQRKEKLEQFNQKFGVEESSKIWTRIYGYIDEFSIENKYQLIIGSENKRTVLFADESLDATNELLIYINKKYEGNK